MWHNEPERRQNIAPRITSHLFDGRNSESVWQMVNLQTRFTDQLASH